jgi:predicted nucleic acid binding AN1-type Zn finger protein
MYNYNLYTRFPGSCSNYGSVILHDSKKEIFHFCENWNLLLHKITQIFKKGNFVNSGRNYEIFFMES